MSAPRSVLRVRLHRGSAFRDVAVDDTLALGDLLPWLSDRPVVAVLDGFRPLEIGPRPLREQGVVDGADLRLVQE